MDPDKIVRQYYRRLSLGAERIKQNLAERNGLTIEEINDMIDVAVSDTIDKTILRLRYDWAKLEFKRLHQRLW